MQKEAEKLITRSGKRFAIIDCGTNTFHLLIVELLANGSLQKLVITKAVVKLARGGILQNTIMPNAFERGIRALEKFRKQLDKFKPDSITAFGTAALRNAVNAADFILAAKNRAGISLQVISGNREAELIYGGVKHSMELGDHKSLVMDIGGGSVEFILCNRKKIFWRGSFKLGAALLLEKLAPSDPVKPSEIKRFFVFFEATLRPLIKICKIHRPVTLVGSSGSFETFADMIFNKKGMKGYPRGQTSFKFVMKDYREIHKLIVKSTIRERMEMKGLVKMRVDMIVMATLLLTFVLQKTGISEMKLSTYALKEGMMNELVSKKIS